jgi:hypothetical protein
MVRRRDTQLTYIFRSDGRGNLQRPLGPFSTFANPSFLAVAGNLTGTRHPDVVARRPNGSLVLFANSGGRNVAGITTTDVVLTDTNRILNVGDWNGDGRGDIITQRTSTGDLLLRAGAADASFSAPVQMGVRASGLRLVAVGDLAGDGFPDLVTQNREGVRRALPGDGGNGFKRGFLLSTGDSASVPVGVGRWDADGSPDLIDRASGALTLRRGNGPGLLYSRGASVGEGRGFSWMSGVGDADGDGRPDLIARNRSTGGLWLLPGSGGQLGAPRLVVDGLEAYDLMG